MIGLRQVESRIAARKRHVQPDRRNPSRRHVYATTAVKQDARRERYRTAAARGDPPEMPGTSAAALLPAAAVLRCASTITIDSLWSLALYSLAYTIIGMLAQKPDSLSNRVSQASLALSRLLWPRYRLSCRPQSSRSSPNSTRSFLRNMHQHARHADSGQDAIPRHHVPFDHV